MPRRELDAVCDTAILAASVTLMAIVSALMLERLFAHLVTTPGGAIDLRYYYSWVRPRFDERGANARDTIGPG